MPKTKSGDTPKVKKYGSGMPYYEHITNLHSKKLKWGDLEPADRKSFSLFLVNQALSSDTEYLELINELQITTKKLNDEEIYSLYMEILPKRSKTYFKRYVSNNIALINNQVLEYIQKYFKISRREANDYVDTLYKTNQTDVIREIVIAFGYNDSDADKIIKSKK